MCNNNRFHRVASILGLARVWLWSPPTFLHLLLLPLSVESTRLALLILRLVRTMLHPTMFHVIFTLVRER